MSEIDINKYLTENQEYLKNNSHIEVEPKLPKATEQSVDDYLELEKFREDNKGLVGQAKTFFGQAADEALFGAPEIAVQNLADPKTKRKIEILKEENPISNTLGGIAGFAGSLAVGGPLLKAAGVAGKAAGKTAAEVAGKVISDGLAKRAIETGVRLGTEGAIYSAPTALTEAVTGNPKGAVERIVAGGAGNALIGGLINGGGKFKEYLAQRPAKFLREKAEQLAENATGATAKQLEKFKPGSGGELLDRGLVGFGDNAENIAEKVTAVKQANGKQIGSVLKNLDEQGARISKTEMMDSLRASVNKLEEDGSQGPIARQLKTIIEDIGNSPLDEYTLTQAEKIKRGFQGRSNYMDPDSTKAVKEAASVFQKGVEKSAVERSPDLADQFQEAKRLYGLFSPIEEAAQRRANQLNQHPFGGFLDMTTAAGGMMTGNPLMGAALPIARRQLAPRVSSSLAVTANAMSKYLKNADGALGEAQKAFMGTFPGARASVTNKLSDYTASYFDKLGEDLSEIENNPEAFLDYVQPQVEALGDIHPEAAGLYTQQIQDVMSYIKKSIPQNPNSVSTPFRKNTWKPTDLQVSKFNRIKKAALQPQSVLEDLSKGILSSDSVNTVRDLYPEYSKAMDEKIIELLQNNPKLTYPQKQQIQLLLKTNYLPEYEPKAIKSLQGNLAIKDQEQQQTQSTGKPINVPNISTDLNKALNPNK